MRALFAVLMCLAGCGHDELDFALPDAGRDVGRRGALDGDGSACNGSGSCQDASEGSTSLGSLPTTEAASSAGFGGNVAGFGGNVAGFGGNVAGAGAPLPNLGFQDDPDGYPTPAGQSAPWCDQMQSFIEVCGTDIDEDCDGTVDEFAGVGLPCRTSCGEGIYVCDRMTNSLACWACSIEVPMPCGDGFVGAEEQCDPAAPNEQAGVTCTLTCERPLFVRCVQAGVASPDVCDELHACSERLGACVPVIGPHQPRCPDLRVEGSESEAETYPMLETEDGECWITCSEADQCPSSLSECYMGFCAVPF